MEKTERNRNLVPFNEMPRERQREIAVKAGIASGAARRAKRERINQAKIDMIAGSELSRTMKQFLTKGIPQARRRL